MNLNGVKRTQIPPYVRVREGADPALASSFDGWVVEPSDDVQADYKKGVEYADFALRQVVSGDNPGALTFPMTCMIAKLINGEIEKGGIERGFMDRVASLAADRREQLDKTH